MTGKKYYPVFLDLENVPCTVVGGGVVAARKVQSLLDAGAQVTVVSPDATAEVQDLARQNRVVWVREPYRRDLLDGARLIIGATNDSAVNERVFVDAEANGIPVNIVDDPAHCRFIVPASLRRGDILVAVSTGGGAPGISAIIRDKVGEVITDEHAELVAQLKMRRARIRALPVPEKERFWGYVREMTEGQLDTIGPIDVALDRLLANAEKTSP